MPSSGDRAAVGTRRWTTFLPAFSYRQYRLLWLSGLSAWVGRWIEMVISAWLVLELTDSPFLVGLLGTCRFASTLLGPFCGTVCDRINQRLVLISVQAVYGSSALCLLALFAAGRMAAWHLFVFTTIGGICFTFDFAARYSIAAGIVREPHIVSSISLLQVANGITSVAGPLIGGSLLEVIGAPGCFTLIAVGFALSTLALVPLKTAPRTAANDRCSLWQELLSGLRYIRDDRVLSSLLLMAALVNLFIYPYVYTLMPIFARDVLGTGSSGFGQLLASVGMGTVLGSLAVGFSPRFATRGAALIGSLLAWPVILLVLSFSRSFGLTMGLLILAGLAQGVSMALVQALLLLRSTDAMRGRVSGARAFAISTLSLGTFLSGYEASLWGVPLVLVINSSVFIVITALMILRVPELARDR
ncbi:MAG: MFS transporter [Syntrophales bacterium]